MRSLDCFGFAVVALFGMSAATGGLDARATGLQPRPATEAAAAAVKASPELVSSVSKEIGATPEQAAGAVGALFGVAKSRLPATDFAQVEKAVPGMDALLKAAPATGGGSGGAGALAQLAGSAGGLASVIPAFTQLGLKPDMVAKVVPVLTSFVTKSGGANVGSLLAGALK
jgi:hypothetical protein